jgi:hypothetical protein
LRYKRGRRRPKNGSGRGKVNGNTKKHGREDNQQAMCGQFECVIGFLAWSDDWNAEE